MRARKHYIKRYGRGPFSEPIPIFIFAAFLVLFFPGATRATGSKVSVQLKAGGEISGELLVVTDSLLVISSSIGLEQANLEKDTAGIFVVHRDDIRSLTICGKSYLADGLLLGGIFGIGVGALLAYEPTGAEAYGSNIDPLGPGTGVIFIGLAGGMALGAFVGLEAATDDTPVTLEGRKHIGFLTQYSRYYDREIPPFVKSYMGSLERR